MKITPRAEDFPRWYQDVVQAADLAEASPVRGCMVIKPHGYAIWEKVQALFYEDAPRVKFGDYFRLDAKRQEVQGIKPGPYMHFWNVWLDKK